VITATREPPSALTRSAAEVEQPSLSTRAPGRRSAGPAVGLATGRTIVGKAGVGDRVFEFGRVSARRRRRRRVSRAAGELMEGFEMRPRRASAITGSPGRSRAAPPRKVAEARDGDGQRAMRFAEPADGGQLASGARGRRDTGRCASSSRAKKSSSGGLHSTRRTSPPPGGGVASPRPAQDAHTRDRRAVHPERGRSHHVSAKKVRADAGRGARAARGGSRTCPCRARGLTYPLCLRSSTTRATCSC